MITSLLFSLDGRDDLAKTIIEQANQWSPDNQTTFGEVRKQKFSDGELCVDFTDSVRGKRVYLLSSPNTSDEIMKLMLTIDAAKRASAREIIPILPYYPYARQDKKDQSRGPIGAKVMAEMIEQRGATSVITFDLHADQIQGFFNIPVTHIEGKNVFDDYIKDVYTDKTVICSCDAGGVKRVKRIVDKVNRKFGFNLQYVIIDKIRTKANIVDSITIIGDVKGKDVIIVDDMVDTFGSADKAITGLISEGALSVKMIASHGVLSGQAYNNIGKSKISELIISDSLIKQDPSTICSEDFNEETCVSIINGSNKIKVISVAKQIAKSIVAINLDTSFENLLV